MKEHLLAASFLAMTAAGPLAGAPSGPVSTSKELVAVLRTARAGQVIQLAAGKYDGLIFRDIKGRNLEVRSANPATPAVIGPFLMENSAGITFRDLEFSNAGGTDAWAWRIVGSQDIHFDRLDLHGTLDGNPQNDRQGIAIRHSSKISITNSTFHELYRSIAPSETHDLKITDNRFHDNARTGIFSSNVQNVLIARNDFTDSYPVEDDHMDAIAFTKIGPTNTTRDIVIADNLITRGKGRVTQGIFLRDSSKGETRYTNIQIRDNMIIGMGLNGIYVNGAENVVIEGNSVLSYPGKANNSWILLQYVRNGKVRGNKASLISITPPANQNLDVIEADNVIVAPVNDNGAAALAAQKRKAKP